MKHLLAVLTSLALVASACASNKDENKDGIADGVVAATSVTKVAPSNPVGTVSGTVMTTVFKGLDGADVTMVLGGQGDASGVFKAQTDADGNFSFKNVPAGSSAQITISKAGYGTVRTPINVPGAVGNVPLNDGNGNVGVILLEALSASVKFNVFTRTGKPAKGVRGLLEVSPAGFVGAGTVGTYGTATGVVSVQATVDENGVATFDNVPDPAELSRVSTASNFTLVLSSFDEDNDGRVDFLGSVNTYGGRDLFTLGQQTILLADARTNQALNIQATNVESLRSGVTSPLRNMLKTNDKIYVLFNQPVLDGASLVAKIVQEDCATSAAMTYALSAQGTLLTITPGAGWAAGVKYAIVIRATPVETSTVANTTAFNGYFFGGDETTPKPVAAATFKGVKAPGSQGSATALLTGDTLYVNFDTPIRNIGGASARVFFNFDLNNNGTTGGMGDVGEYGGAFNTGLTIVAAEPATDSANTFSCSASGYTTRWAVNLPALPLNGVPSGTPVKVVFSKDTSTSDGYQTVWGVPVLPTNSELAGTLAVSN